MAVGRGALPDDVHPCFEETPTETDVEAAASPELSSRAGAGVGHVVFFSDNKPCEDAPTEADDLRARVTAAENPSFITGRLNALRRINEHLEKRNAYLEAKIALLEHDLKGQRLLLPHCLGAMEESVAALRFALRLGEETANRGDHEDTDE